MLKYKILELELVKVPFIFGSNKVNAKESHFFFFFFFFFFFCHCSCEKIMFLTVVSNGAVVLRGGQDIRIHGGRRCFGGEIGRKEEVILRAGSS
jgi:hypothetical protein